MFWHSLGVEVWFAAVLAATGGIVRGVKALFPRLPPDVLPVLALALGYLIFFLDLLLDASAPASSDARVALWGVLVGAGAVAGHETAKKAITRVLSLVVGEPRATQIAERILGKLGTVASPPPTEKKKPVATLFVFVVLGLVGCVRPLDAAIASSNAAALSLSTTHEQLIATSAADQEAAAKAVKGDREDPVVRSEQLKAAAAAAARYRPAWKAYTAARVAWLRVVAGIELAQRNPELFAPASLVGLISALADASAELEAYARDSMRAVRTLGPDAPPPAPEVTP